MSQSTVVRSKSTAQGKERETRSKSPTHSAYDTRSKAKLKPAAEVSTQVVQRPSYDEARSYLSANNLIPSLDPCTPQILATALKNLAETGSTMKIPTSLQKAIVCLSEVTSKLETRCAGCAKAEVFPKILKDACLSIQLDIHERMDELEQSIAKRMADQEEISKATERMEATARSLDKVASEALAKVTKASDTTSQLANTASSYRDALLNNTMPGPDRGGTGQVTEAEICMATDRKERQVLIEVDETQILAHSYDSLREKVENTIGQITDPPPPGDTSITQVTKVRKNGLIINFSSKEAAQWLKRSDVGPTFAAQFIPGSTIRPRQFPLLVPRIPLTFNPEDNKHLREAEEGNSLDKNAIAKARWIKPVYRRALGQKAAHATFLFNDAVMANKCIKDGMYICGAKVYPTRLKQEPTQCMKCRRWGHYATDCIAQKDICGTCGGEHRSSDCRETEKRYCISCRSGSHASWDRNCPEFVKRCAWYDEKHPDNTLKLFPTEDTWTQEVRPPKFPFEERFPAQFAVGSLPPPNRNGRELPTRPITKQNKRPKKKGKSGTGQTTIEGYFPSSQSQGRADGEDTEEAEEQEVYHSMNQSDYADSASANTSIC